jgi:hypothetical protein
MKISEEFIEQRAEEYVSLKNKSFLTFERYLNYTWHTYNRYIKSKLYDRI